MWGELSSEYGASCLGASFLLGELSLGELSLGRVVLIPYRISLITGALVYRNVPNCRNGQLEC